MTKSKKTIGLLLGLIFLSGLFLVSFPAPAAGQGAKIGVFDLQRAINKSKKGQAAKAKLSGKFERLQKDLSRREAEIERLQKELETQGSMLSADARRQKQKTLRNKIRDFQDKYRDYTEEMKKDEFQNTQPLINTILQSASRLGKEQGYTLIIEVQKAGVVYAPDALDITEEVISRVDSGR